VLEALFVVVRVVYIWELGVILKQQTMGLFNIFKSKDKQTPTPQTAPKTQKGSLTNFDCYYIYGLTDNPFRQSKDLKSFVELYKKVIGIKGGVVIGSSFHPYQLVNPKGIVTSPNLGQVVKVKNKK
jgi:hypothetical protein